MPKAARNDSEVPCDVAVVSSGPRSRRTGSARISAGMARSERSFTLPSRQSTSRSIQVDGGATGSTVSAHVFRYLRHLRGTPNLGDLTFKRPEGLGYLHAHR